MNITTFHKLPDGALFQVVSQKQPKNRLLPMPAARGVWKKISNAYSVQMVGHRHSQMSAKEAIFGVADRVSVVKP